MFHFDTGPDISSFVIPVINEDSGNLFFQCNACVKVSR